KFLPLSFQVEDRPETQERLASDGLLAHRRGLPELSPRVRPTGNFARRAFARRRAGFAAEHGVVDRMGVRLDVAGESPEHVTDGGAGVPRLILEEDVILIGEDHEEVALAASLPLLGGQRLGPYANARGVRREAEGGPPRFLGAGIDDGPERGPDVLGVAAHGPVIEVDFLGR